MSSSPVIDTSTISPLVVPTVSSGYTPTSTYASSQGAPMTLAPVQAQAIESAAYDTVQTSQAVEATVSPPTSPTLPPTAPSSPTPLPIIIPDVVSMETDLRTVDQLVVQTPASSTLPAPLSHLQPDNLLQTATGPKASIAPTPMASPAQSILLASTAPTLRAPTLTQVVFQAKSKKEENDPAQHYIISGILIVLTVVSVSVLALFLFQQYQISRADSAALGNTKTSVLDLMLEKLPFASKDTSSQDPEAVWYQ